MTTEQTLILILAVAGFVVTKFVRARYRHEFIVTDGFAGLLYHDGKFVETLAAGRHVRWGKNYRVALVDTRKTLLQVAGHQMPLLGIVLAENVVRQSASCDEPSVQNCKRANPAFADVFFYGFVGTGAGSTGA